MKNYFYPKRLMQLLHILIFAISCALVLCSPYCVKADTQKDYGYIQEDNYRKTLCKGFLGKRYGAMIDGIRCDCSGYTKAALQRMKSQNATGSFKNYKLKARCTSAWVAGSSATYTSGKVIAGEATWNTKKTKTKVGKKSKSNTSLKALALGDVMVYGKGSTSTHIAVYFGEFDSAKDVLDYLVDNNIIQESKVKKVNKKKYTYNGRTIIRSYTNSTHWRIHATNAGIMIDNDIKGTSNYTSSFGKWKWTFETGIKTLD